MRKRDTKRNEVSGKGKQEKINDKEKMEWNRLKKSS